MERTQPLSSEWDSKKILLMKSDVLKDHYLIILTIIYWVVRYDLLNLGILKYVLFQLTSLEPIHQWYRRSNTWKQLPAFETRYHNWRVVYEVDIVVLLLACHLNSAVPVWVISPLTLSNISPVTQAKAGWPRDQCQRQSCHRETFYELR